MKKKERKGKKWGDLLDFDGTGWEIQFLVIYYFRKFIYFLFFLLIVVNTREKKTKTKKTST